MKILVLQLARLGDIYMSWPALRALRRAHPQAEIHLLTRPRFEGAVEGLTAVDRHWTLPAGEILSPMVKDECDIETSLERLDHFVDGLKAESFDWIINFTFSPASSYLAHALTQPQTQITGYTRFKDGSLCLADEVSSYFYAQVGIDKPNRVHVADVLASMLNLEYIEADWSAPDLPECTLLLPERYMVLHVGASEQHKALSSATWSKLLNYFAKRNNSLPVVLIGAPNERALATEIQNSVSQIPFVNLVGQTRIADLFSILKKAEVFVGCDSAPIHIASLTDTPTLNISVGQVNFWETGPKATLAFIYRAENEAALSPERVGEVLASLLEGQVAEELIVRTGGLESYAKDESPEQRFQWELVKALYLGGAYPMAERIEILQGAAKLHEINTFAMEQIALIPEKGLQMAGPLLDRAEEVIESISQWVPELSPLISWYQAEKIRIGPGSLEEICSAALNVHERLGRHLRVYIPQETQEEVGDGTL
ncbi:glycosyltransferase family 9 protein [Bdellovibrio bacteriovorus]|uniref:glycosyltransferase family 9 protein n=1 Tax=Bdellovibrio bacteriovorus TaxID=959 RepID=UPI0035A590F9